MVGIPKNFGKDGFGIISKSGETRAKFSSR
jgi:hypothetical protein